MALLFCLLGLVLVYSGYDGYRLAKQSVGGPPDGRILASAFVVFGELSLWLLMASPFLFWYLFHWWTGILAIILAGTIVGGMLREFTAGPLGAALPIFAVPAGIIVTVIGILVR